MKKIWRNGLLFVAVCAATISQGISREDLLPADTVMVFHMTQGSNLVNRLTTSPLGRLWKDPQVRAFLGLPQEDDGSLLVDWFVTRIAKKKLPQKEADAEKKEAMRRLLREELTLIFDREFLVGARTNNTICALIAATQEQFERGLELDRLETELGGTNEYRVVKEDFQGVTLYRDLSEGETNAAWECWVNGTVLVSDDRSWIERTIIRLKKAEKIDEPKGEPSVSCSFLNIPFWLKEGEIPEDLAAGLGLSAVQRMTCSLTFPKDRLEIDVRMTVTDPDAGLFGLLDKKPVDLSGAPYVPPDVAAFRAGRFRLSVLPDLVRKVLVTAGGNPQQVDVFLASFQQITGVDLVKDLLEALGPEYYEVDRVTENAHSLSVMAFTVRDGAAFAKHLEAVLGAEAFQNQVAALLEKEEFLGRTVYRLKTQGETDSLSFCVGNHFLFIGDPGLLRAAVRAEQNGGEDYSRLPLLRELRARSPADAFFAGAVDWSRELEPVLRMCRTPAFEQNLNAILKKNFDLQTSVSLEKMPSAEHLAEFFGPAFAWARIEDNGVLHWHYVAPYPQ